MSESCPCGSGTRYVQCCRPYHDGKAAPSAEALMRSRYSAYVLGDIAYLHRSWHPRTRPTRKSLMQSGPTEWLGLEIIGVQAGQATDQVGQVEFIAQYRSAGLTQRLHERSRFVKEAGRWVYVDALELPAQQSEEPTEPLQEGLG